MSEGERERAIEAETVVEAEPARPTGAEEFRLQGELPRVMRLSRKTLAVIGGAAGLAIAGALLWALRSPAAQSEENLYDTGSPNKSEVVTGGPADYRSVPKLGPPLPGDLGRPIVSAQKAGENVPVPGMAPAPDPKVTAAEQARARALQEREAAQASRLFLGSASTSSGDAERSEAMPIAAPAAALLSEAASTSGMRRRFMEGGGRQPTESKDRLIPPASPYIVQAGAVIPAALITGIRSDLPGQITAQVTQNVYDSPTGRILLIPQGARLLGNYDSEVAAGQSRVLLAWDRLILPGGHSITLDRQPGADASGMAGLEDRVDNHWGRMLRAALVSTLLGVGSELAMGGDSELVRALRTGTQDSAGQAGQRVVEREMAVPPTLTIRAGAALRVIVTRDLILEPFDRGGGR